MRLDVQTLLVMMLAIVFAMAVALPAIMGWRRVGSAPRCIQSAAVAQALGWAAFLVAPAWHDRFFSSLSMALIGASFVLMWHGVAGWLGPRPGRRLLWALAVATPLGYGIGFDHYAFRVGWANFGLALQIGLVCLALAWPAPGASRRWRALVLLCLGAMAIVTAWRGVLGAFFPELYPYYRAPHPVNVVAAFLNPVAVILSTIGLLVAWREEAERNLVALANTDALTGLLNRRAFSTRAGEALAQARRYGDDLAVLMIDIDHFKQINDRHGHDAGDRALRLVADALRACVRTGDLVCRWGGEEFCVLMSRADAAAARAFDARLRERLRAASAAEPFDIDFSCGLAGRRDGDTAIEDLLRRADGAMYQAKADGRARLTPA